jgi:glycosyltransferase involved in cell wall biosynthesis
MHKPLHIWLPAIQTGTGSDVYTARLADALNAVGYTATVQFFNSRYEFCPALLARTCPPEGTDIIHANSWNAYAFKRPGIPLVVTEHHYIDDPAFKPFRTPLQSLYHRAHVLPAVRRSYGASSAVVAVSNHTAAAIKQQCGMDAVSIPNWIDTQQFHPVADTPRQCRPLRCLFVGNPSRRKGSDLLPVLANMLPTDIQIHCLGGLRRQDHKNTEARSIIMLPRHAPADMPALYRSMDAVLVPTRYEAFGYVALEAMACGLPVIGFNSTGTAEICIDGDTALLGPVDDLATLASNLVTLRDNPALRARLGRNGRARALAIFDGQAAIAAYLNLYQQVQEHRDHNA